MKALITGSNGTVGTALKTYIQDQGDISIGWDRDAVSIDDYHAMEAYIRDINPDVLYHLAVASQSTGRENEGWFVNYHWTSELAWICRQLDIQFVFTSSVMVFTDDAQGPFTVDSVPDAEDGYGYEKLQAEQRVFHQNPNAIVARLGWQIGDSAGSNNMINFLEDQMQEHGQVNCSDKWYPACSFLPDTAEGLYRIVTMESGLYLLDSNEKWTFFEIASALDQKHGNPWKIERNSDFFYDQRMQDPRPQMNSLATRLPSLP